MENLSYGEGYEYVIEPRRGWLNMTWRELAHYQDLIFLLVRRDFVSKYKQTALGPLWFLVQPLFTTIIYVVIFARAARLSTAGLPPVLFYLSGLLLWGYFAQSFNAISNTFTTNINLFSKVYFPRLVVPLATVLSNSLSLLIQLGLFLTIYAYYALTANLAVLRLSWWLAALPLLWLQVAAVSLGVGLIASALTAKYRDLLHLTAFLIQAGMFVTPVIYPLNVIPEKWQRWFALNPLTGSIEALRYLFFATAPPSKNLLLASAAMTLLLLLLGLLLFGRAEKTFVDTV